MAPTELQETHDNISKEGIIIVSIEILFIFPDGILKIAGERKRGIYGEGKEKHNKKRIVVCITN